MFTSEVLVLVIIVVSAIGVIKPSLQDKLAFTPYYIKHNKQWYRFFTGALVHASFFHLLVNMFVLRSFGKLAEGIYANVFSPTIEGLLVLLLFFSGSAASVLITYKKYKDDEEYSAVGASGAISTVVFTVLMYKAFSSSNFGYFQASIAAIALIYLIYNAIVNYSKYKKVNHDAHLYGALYGILINVLINPRLLINFWEGMKGLL